ncbi:MAG: ABC transporter ATP-binding protein [Puniceicoccales bacterium]|jgi:ABC-type dipeptide/oligopeptide/nickel transport system ATPase component|nr:ABC transporter ATP-binding protein [Puniceicoccales bacterium]
MALLQLRSVTISFPRPGGWAAAVREVDLTLDAGRTLSLIGASGSGKTLTALAIGRLLPDGARLEGKISFAGQDLADGKALRRLRGAQIAYVFQEPMACLNPRLRAGDQIGECLRLHRPELSRGEIRDRVLHWLERLHLPDPRRVLHSYPHMLSGGMLQRVMIAMALCTGPRLLIADEPTSALDGRAQRLLLDLLMELQGQLSFSLLFISHNLRIAKLFNQSVAVMDGGRIVEVGPVAEVFARPARAQTAQLLACSLP